VERGLYFLGKIPRVALEELDEPPKIFEVEMVAPILCVGLLQNKLFQHENRDGGEQESQ
jgi:hypothetical protein